MYIAVVTGASSGMGRESAEFIAKTFHRIDEVWVIARRKERMAELKEMLPSYAAGKIRIIAGDVSSKEFCDELSAMLSEKNPKIAFLVNAAGFGKIGAAVSLSEGLQADMIRVNDEALVRITRICLPYMAERAGRIINFSSSAAFLPQPDFAVYAASKSFVLSFSQALDFELSERRIGVTAVCPGPVRTEFFAIAEEYSKIPVYKRLVMAKPEAVVRKAFKDAIRRKPVSVYGVFMKAFRLLALILPKRFIFKIMKAF